MKIAIKIGGSISINGEGPRKDFVSKFAEVVRDISFDTLCVGIGGGKLARNYLQAIEPFLNDQESELVVLDILRANTRFMASVLGGRAVLDESSLNLLSRGQDGILVIGGIKPGRSTDANTALLGEKVGVDLFVKMTNVRGVFDADPASDPGAQLIRRMTYDQLYELSIEGSPGSYGILDRLAIDVLKRSGIPTRIIDGRRPKGLKMVLEGKDLGTLVLPED